MKKKLSYRDKLLELVQIYNVKEVQEYIKEEKFNHGSVRINFKEK